MQSFLSKIAQVYCARESDAMLNYCFIFPNKRSGTFFRKFLAEHTPAGQPMIEPEVTTISDFIAEFSDKIEASRYDLLFTLYNEYNRLTDEIEDFDRFVFWGDMLINDFNDVDKYMVDAHELFANVKHLKEINSDYLTDEQKQIINEYWGENLPLGSSERFWTHVTNDGEPHKNRDDFMKLWQVLAPLYDNFRTNLAKRRLCYSGMQYREAADNLKRLTRDDIPYSRVVIVGFNVLSIAEVKIFERLRNLGIADFYWDMNFPEFIRENNSAVHFIKKYIKKFPSRYDLNQEPVTTLPKVEIIGVPSNVGQVKLIGRMLEKMAVDGTVSNPSNAIDTAVVLPSEELFIELLHSLPPVYTSVNITMGYPLKLTPMAALLRNIVSMHLRAKKIRGEWCFFHEDIKDVISHSLLTAIAGKTCEAIKEYLNTNRLFTVSAKDLRELFPELSTIFYPVDDLKEAGKVFDYTLTLIQFIDDALQLTSDDKERHALEHGFLTRYRQSVEQLARVAAKYDITMKENTFFHLIERTVSGESVNFIGEPLNGLQIMGVLETRALDFDNIIIPSMNERIFPRKHYTRSFIPDLLRRCYGMATIEFQECIYAYYFYRMISRASNVTLLYDARTAGARSSEMSRYLYQLLYLYPDGNVRHRNAFFDIPATGRNKPLEIKKSPDIMRRINRYLASSDEKRYLSPSSINCYINCPLQFYLQYVCDLYIDDDVVDYMDESTLGTIVHRVAELSYKRCRGDKPEIKITSELLDSLMNEKVELERLITRSINESYNKLPNNSPNPDSEYVNDTPLFGQALVIGRTIVHFMKKLFELEKQWTPFYFVEGEKKYRCTYKLNDKITVNLTSTIDRIDRIVDNNEERVRIVDYKTGSDNTDVKEFTNLFEKTGSDKRAKAVLQLFIYSNVYAMDNNYHGPLQPMLYCFRQFSINGIQPVKIAKEPLTDYRIYNEEFKKRLSAKLSDLFNPEVPFTPNPHSDTCKYCKFKLICGQAVEN